jgi:hypothetical protein
MKAFIIVAILAVLGFVGYGVSTGTIKLTPLQATINKPTVSATAPVIQYGAGEGITSSQITYKAPVDPVIVPMLPTAPRMPVTPAVQTPIVTPAPPRPLATSNQTGVK